MIGAGFGDCCAGGSRALALISLILGDRHGDAASAGARLPSDYGRRACHGRVPRFLTKLLLPHDVNPRRIDASAQVAEARMHYAGSTTHKWLSVGSATRRQRSKQCAMVFKMRSRQRHRTKTPRLYVLL